MRLYLLVRISDVEKLIEVIGKDINSSKSPFKGVFVYERCLAVPSTKSVRHVPEAIRALEKLTFHDTIEGACGCALEAMGQGQGSNLSALNFEKLQQLQ